MDVSSQCLCDGGLNKNVDICFLFWIVVYVMMWVLCFTCHIDTCVDDYIQCYCECDSGVFAVDVMMSI